MPRPTVRLRSLQRALRSLLCCLVLAPLLLIGAPAWAATAPASEARMDLYMRLSAINFCLARSIGQLDVAQAVPIAGETVVVILQNEHASRIRPVGEKPLSLEELRRGAYDSVLIGALTFCPQEIPEEMRQSLEAAIKDRADQASGAAGPGGVAGSGLPVPAPPAQAMPPMGA